MAYLGLRGGSWACRQPSYGWQVQYDGNEYRIVRGGGNREHCEGKNWVERK